MEINGVAHVMLTVSDFATCLPFYEQLLHHCSHASRARVLPGAAKPRLAELRLRANRPIPGADVVGRRADEAVVADLLDDVGRPTDRA